MSAYIEWHCPECGKTARTPAVHTPAGKRSETMHQCPKLRGLIAPMVRVGDLAQIIVHEPEDYIGGKGKTMQTDPEEGRPLMSMETRYADGHTDLVVYAPSATMKIRR